VNSFAERLQNSKSLNTENELLNRDLSRYIKKTNLSTRLENIKKVPLKED